MSNWILCCSLRKTHILFINHSIELVLFTEDCTFKLRGHSNCQNRRYWSKENIRRIREEHTQFSEKIMSRQEMMDHIIGTNLSWKFDWR